eukprot:3383842-Pleurochrysis_carterae.AAC.1
MVPELSRTLAELAESDGGITHRQRSTVRESGVAPASRLCYIRRGELGFTTAALRPALHNARTKRCVVSLQKVSIFQRLEAARMPKSAATMAFQYLTTFVREVGPWDSEGLWGARSSQFVLHATRPILLSKLLGAARPAMPAHFGQLPSRQLEQLRV